ncbi:MAG: NUDIX hydrolase [Actinobacteria bacterium]|nr:NUDIX hydrolase [Actinomycetota bacterium]
MNSKMFEEKKSSREIFKGEILGLYFDRVKLPDGKTAYREKVTHPGAVAIVPVSNDGKVILVRQYRYPVEEITIEIPAGKIDRNEDPEDCAKRELAEEIGAVNVKLTHLSSFYTTPGFCNEILHLFIATDFKKTGNNPEEDEFLEVIETSLGEALSLIENGEIKDAKTIIGILMARDYINGKSNKN